MKKVKFLFFLILIAIGGIGIYGMVNIPYSIDDVEIVLKNYRDDQSVKLFEKNEQLYLFLPSYNKKEVQWKYNEAYKLFLNDLYYTPNDNCMLNVGEEYELKIKNSFGAVVYKNNLKIEQSSHSATLSIRLFDGDMKEVDLNKTVRKEVGVTAVGENGDVNCENCLATIHSRGNSTWQSEKKPYVLKFDADVDLFGMGNAKKWILLANATDFSGIKNQLVYDTALQMGDKYAPMSQNVDLYIDGRYYGQYLLSEAVEVGAERVDIADLEKSTSDINEKELNLYKHNIETDKSEGVLKWYDIPNDPKNITGGYLLEETNKPDDETSLLKTSDGIYFGVREPAYASKKQMEYIYQIMQNVEDHLTQEDIAQYIDLESWARYYLIQELFGNTDQASFFFYKNENDDKVYAGPVWDFDLSLGACFEAREFNKKASYVSTWGWYNELLQNEVFLDEVKRLYKSEFRKKFVEIENKTLNQYKEKMDDAFRVNCLRWKGNLSLENLGFYPYYDDLDKHIEEMKLFLEERIEFFDELWLENKKIYTVCINPGVLVYWRKYITVQENDTIDQLPVPTADGYRFVNWMDCRTGCEYKIGTKINRNYHILAKWEKQKEDGRKQIKIMLYHIKTWILENKVSIIFSFICIICLVVCCLIQRKRNMKR